MKSNLLVGIPLLYHGETCRKAINSVVNECDVLLVDNGADADVKEVINEFDKRPNVFVIRHEVNQYVNPAWNDIMQFFLNWNHWEQLVIMNSDLILSKGWSNHLVDGESCLVTDGSHKVETVATEGVPGVFIHGNTQMFKMVYPIPEEIKLWFGDFYTFSIWRELGYKTIIKPGLIAEHWHNGSQTIAILPNKSEMIEADKVAWAEVVEPLMWERIKQLKNGK
jgi:hypothetical protein